jgi:hypothetical protein
MTLDDWFTWATADAERRGLPSLAPLLEGLRHATRELREMDWNEDRNLRPVAGPSAGSDSAPAPGSTRRTIASSGKSSAEPSAS